MLRVGDFIMANVNINGAIQSGVFIVKTNAGSVVNVANHRGSGRRSTAD